MPNRLLREGLMESERVLSMPVEARWLFVVIILSADDIGLFEATEFKLARRADVNRELAAKLMTMLADVDLVRFYLVNGKRYGFIPRFRQRIQIKRARHPLPPEALLADDLDALTKIKDLASHPTDGQPWSNGWATDGQPSEPEPEPEPEVDIQVSDASHPRRRVVIDDAAKLPGGKRELIASEVRSSAPTKRLPACPFDRIRALYNESLPDEQTELPPKRATTSNEDRKKLMSASWKWLLTEPRDDGTLRANNEKEALDWFAKYFAKAWEDDHLAGRTARSVEYKNWRCDLDHLLKARVRTKVIEA